MQNRPPDILSKVVQLAKGRRLTLKANSHLRRLRARRLNRDRKSEGLTEIYSEAVQTDKYVPGRPKIDL